MSLGILNNVSAIYAENNLNNTQASLQTVLQQLSSGARINSGADDAAGLAIANGLKANENALTQSAQNASDGIGLLSTADGALSQVTNLLDRAVTLATEAANGTLSSTQVSSANQEYQSIITEIGNIGSTTNFNGNNVFSNTATAFYVGDGTSTGSNFYSDVTGNLSITSVGQAAPTSTASTVIAPTSSEAHNTASPTNAAVTGNGTTTYSSEALTYANSEISGALTFSDGTSAGATVTISQNSTVAQAAAQLNANSTFAANYTAVATSATVLTLSSKNLATTAPTYTATNTAQASVAGSQTYTLANANDTLAGTIAFQQGALSVSANFAAGTTLQQAIAQINANGSSFQAAGVTAAAYVAGATTLVLTNTNTPAVASNLFSYSTNSGTTLTDNQTITQLGKPTIVSSGYSSNVGTASTATYLALQNPTTDDIVGNLRVSVGATGNPVSVQFAQGTTLAAAVLQLNGNAQLKAAGVVASASGGSLVLTGPVGTAANPTGNTLSTTGSLLFDTPATGQPGAGTDFTANSLATLTTGNAQNVLTGVNQAIQNVSYQRGILGAYSNQLTAASNTAASENVNLTSAESAIRSTNYGEATSDLAKYEVLSQTGISALAQANSVQQEILKLLQ